MDAVGMGWIDAKGHMKLEIMTCARKLYELGWSKAEVASAFPDFADRRERLRERNLSYFHEVLLKSRDDDNKEEINLIGFTIFALSGVEIAESMHRSRIAANN